MLLDRDTSRSCPMALRVGPGSSGLSAREAFERGLRELGWTPGTNILIDYRYGEGKPERLPKLARELARIPVDVIVASATIGVRAAQQATRTIPIVMSTLPDPVGQGFVTSLAHPGGNTTGLTLDAEELAGKQMELLKEAVPTLSLLAVLRNASSQRSPGSKERWASHFPVMSVLPAVERPDGHTRSPTQDHRYRDARRPRHHGG